MSVAFDSFWHWRANFGGWPSNPYATTGVDESLAADHRPEVLGSQRNTKPVEMTHTEGWSTPVYSTGPGLEGIPVDFGYFPNGEWWTDVSFVDPMTFSFPQFDDQIQMQNEAS